MFITELMWLNIRWPVWSIWDQVQCWDAILQSCASTPVSDQHIILFFAFILPNRVYSLQFKTNVCMVCKLSFERFGWLQDFMSISVRKFSDIWVLASVPSLNLFNNLGQIRSFFSPLDFLSRKWVDWVKYSGKVLPIKKKSATYD